MRVIGLRAFSKMTFFDFVTTVAIGPLVAGCVQATHWSALAQALIAELREANVLPVSDVRAVMLESTGDISAPHGENLVDVLLDDVSKATGASALAQNR